MRLLFSQAPLLGQVASQSGKVAPAKSYDPYGVVIYTSNASQTDYGLTEKSSDIYIKLIDLRSRMHSPETGRLATKDS